MKNSIKILFSLALVLPIMAMAMLSTPKMNPAGDGVEAGKALFQAKACFACHAANGEGNALGPNLTDKFTKQGCSEEDIIKVIGTGVAGTAMASYKDQLKPEEIKALAQYIISIVGSNPANAKAAEGNECK